MNQRLTLTIAAWMAASAWTQFLAACPFCTAPTFTLAELADQKDTVVLTKWSAATAATDDTLGSTVYEVIDVLKSNEDSVVKGDKITLNTYQPGNESDLFLLYASRSDTLQWDAPMEMTEGSYLYIKKAPNPEVDRTTRLKYFLNFLEYPDNTVSNDAYGEFALAPYKDIVPLTDLLPRDRLRKWIQDEETDPSRLGLYGLMIGLCGTEEDRVMLEKIVLDQGNEDGFRLGVEGLMAGYLMLAGESGLDKMEKLKLEPRYIMRNGKPLLDKNGNKQKMPYSEVYAGMQALRFMWTYTDGIISKERLKKTMRKLLDRPNMSDLVLIDLSRWKDWSVMDRLMTMYDEEDYAVPSFQRQVARYMIAATKDVPQGASEKPEHVKKAEGYLAELRKIDPEIVEQAERYFIADENF